MTLHGLEKFLLAPITRSSWSTSILDPLICGFHTHMGVMGVLDIIGLITPPNQRRAKPSLAIFTSLMETTLQCQDLSSRISVQHQSRTHEYKANYFLSQYCRCQGCKSNLRCCDSDQWFAHAGFL